MADVSKVKVSGGAVYDLKDAVARAALETKADADETEAALDSKIDLDQIDTTLTQTGHVAEAKAVGDAIGKAEGVINKIGGVDLGTLKSGYYINSATGVETSVADSSVVTDYVEVTPGKRLVIENVFTYSNRGVVCYDANKAYVIDVSKGHTTNGLTNVSFVVPHGCAYFRVTSKSTANPVAYYDDNLANNKVNAALYKTTDQSYNYVKREYISLSGSIGSTVDFDNPVTSTTYGYIILPCHAGDTFVLTATGGAAPRAWAFTDNSRALLQVSPSNETVTEFLLTAPADGFFISNHYLSNDYSLAAKQLFQAAPEQYALGAYPTGTVSGKPVTISDGADGIPVMDITVDIEPMQSGSGDPTPSNVRPISGWTGATIYHRNRNMMPNTLTSKTASGVTITVDDNGVITLNGTSTVSDAATQNICTGLVLPAGDYLFGVIGDVTETNVYAVRLREGTGSWTYLNSARANGYIPFTSTGGSFTFQLYIYGNAVTNNYRIYPMVVPGTGTLTVDDYVPYVEQQYSVTFPSEAGTVYGGTLDVTTGVLTVTFGYVELTADSLLDAGSSASYGQYARTKLGTLPGAVQNGKGWCSHYKVVQSVSSIAGDPSIRSMDTGNAIIYDSRFTDLSTAKSVIGTVQFVYELATPVTYQLTPQEVRTLLGNNNIWADCGNTAATYRADTKLYIERLTQPAENDMVADHAISNGAFFMVGNDLYLATAAIASGATINVGTNATRLSLADALNTLNS